MSGCFQDTVVYGKYLHMPHCPQCGVNKPNLRKITELCTVNDPNLPGTAWGMFVCAHCLGMIMAETAVVAVRDVWTVLGDPYRTYPGARSVSPDVPARAQKYLTQALNSIAQPDAAVMMAGSAIDAMLKAKGMAEGSVHRRINEAVASHLITQGMADWAHEVRLAANEQRHSDDESEHATTDDAKRLVEFAMALAEFLFVLPARIEKGRAGR